MGNINDCCRVRGKKGVNFAPNEKKGLKKVFRSLTKMRGRKWGDKNGNDFSIKAFASLFPKGSESFAKRMYTTMQCRTPEPHTIDFNVFMEFAEVLC